MKIKQMNRIEVVGDICLIHLENEVQNYLTSSEFISPSELSKTIGSKKCKAILITGTGRHLSAGADQERLFKMANENNLDAEISKGKSLFELISSFDLPVIACIEGVCYGGGLEIALLADIKFASREAMFAFPESNPGEFISAEEALDRNLIDYLVETNTTSEHGLTMAKKLIRSRDIDVIKAVVESIRNSEVLEYDKAIERETELFCHLARVTANKK